MGVYIWTEKPLMSYEEIVSMATAEGGDWTNTIAELNTDAGGYYNMLSSQNKLENCMVYGYGIEAPGIIGIVSPISSSYSWRICYDSGEWHHYTCFN